MDIDPELEAFIALCAEGLSHQVRGNSGPLLALWSRADDVAVLGAIGSHTEGYERVRKHLLGAAQSLDWDELSVERLLTATSGDIAVTVTLEHMRRHTGKLPAARTLRATQGYRREQGAWRLFLRHANTITPEDEERERNLLASDDTFPTE